MTLYQKYETENAYAYLQQVVDLLEEPVCILGGWAVYFTPRAVSSSATSLSDLVILT